MTRLASSEAAREWEGRPAGARRLGSAFRRGRDLVDAVEAQGALVRAQLDRWFRPRGSLVRPLADRLDAPSSAPSLVVERVHRGIDRAARRGLFRPACLVRSLAVARLLERHGVTAWQIRVGVRRSPAAGAGALDAHAWVEVDGRVVGDDPRYTRHFTPLGSVTVAPDGRRRP